MAKIKHVAIRTRDIEKTASFYKDAFGLEQVGVGQNGIYLSDGDINIAVLKFAPEGHGEPLRLGVDHIGFQVEDVDVTVAKVSALGGRALPGKNPVEPREASQPQSYYEVKCIGPDDQVIDISTAGWVGARKA
ncbi:MAG TPA: VOC family protein [Candidatus Binatia bacterium]|nr:VOC family protein [Candidatus Binatia bacterium]